MSTKTIVCPKCGGQIIPYEAIEPTFTNGFTSAVITTSDNTMPFCSCLRIAGVRIGYDEATTLSPDQFFLLMEWGRKKHSQMEQNKMSRNKPKIDPESEIYIATKTSLRIAVKDLIEAGLGLSKALELNVDHAHNLATEYVIAEKINASREQIHLLATRLIREIGQEAKREYQTVPSTPMGE